MAACELHGRAEENKEEKGSYEFVSDFGYHVTRRLPDVSFPLRAHVSLPLPSPLVFIRVFKSNILILGRILFSREREREIESGKVRLEIQTSLINFYL